MSVYGAFDQDQLDAQYNCAQAVGDVQKYFTEWQERSASARANLSCSVDVPYGPGTGETLDIFFPHEALAPVHVFLHGGFWRTQDKGNFSFIAEPLISQGAAVIIPNYDLCPAVSLDVIVQQSRTALAWAYRNARLFGGDPNHITVSGHSAGAHLAVRALEADWSTFNVPDNFLKAVIGISGVYDLEPVRRSYLNADLRLGQQESLRNSPQLHVPRSKQPLVIAAGSEETPEFQRQSRDYVQSLAGKGFTPEHVTVENADHYNILDEYNSPISHLGKRIFELALANEHSLSNS